MLLNSLNFNVNLLDSINFYLFKSCNVLVAKNLKLYTARGISTLVASRLVYPGPGILGRQTRQDWIPKDQLHVVTSWTVLVLEWLTICNFGGLA